MTGSRQPDGATEPAPDPNIRSKRHSVVAWACTAVTLATYIGLMIAVSLAPSFMAGPVVDNGVMTLGIAIGAAIIVFLIVVAAVFTVWNNKLDEPS